MADPNDALFARVLAYGPDPLLSGTLTHLLVPAPAAPVGPTTWFDMVEALLPTPPEPPALPVDPEPIRVIVPAQPEDSSGLDAMIGMPPAAPPAGEPRPRHFLVPLPPGVDPESPELFGFWTYELRIGHKDIWSTAQARYGRPAIVKGVQHPAPGLRCTAVRVRPAAKQPPPALPPRIVVAAPHATTVFADKRLTDPAAGDPRTRIWVLLYAQVTQADGATSRNVLLARAPAAPRVQREVTGAARAPETRDVTGVAQFQEKEIEQRLAELALPIDSPLSVVAVELLPGDHLIQGSVELGDRQLFYTVDLPDIPAGGAAGYLAGYGPPSDPLGAELGGMGSRRILRCSPLTPVAPAC
ncbi:MAG: hypothetical protein LC796_09615 [Acidobacteria bacterium]|nr:hypothetical protein [Acidobacteriota bacterium]